MRCLNAYNSSNSLYLRPAWECSRLQVLQNTIFFAGVGGECSPHLVPKGLQTPI